MARLSFDSVSDPAHPPSDLAQIVADVDPVRVATAKLGGSSESPDDTQGTTDRLDVLLLEPHALTGQLAAAALRAAHWRVHLCHDADTAISIAARQAPRLIVSEACLPGFSVDRFVDALRTAFADRAPRYLVLASIPAAAREALEAVGVDAVVHKPFAPLELVAACDELLNRESECQLEPAGGAGVGEVAS